MSTHHRDDIVVIGAGITGSSAAFFLARQGRSVTLVDRSGVGNQASRHNPGGLNPLHGPGIPGVMSPMAMHSFSLHLEHQEMIAQLSGEDVSVRRVSRLELAFDESEQLALENTIGIYEKAEGFTARWLDRRELLAAEARVNPDAIGGLLLEGNRMVDSRRYTLAVSKAAQKLGARFVSGNVVGLKRLGSRITGVVLDSGEIPCGSVVIATGPWVSDVDSWLGLSIPVAPLKGELLLASWSGSPFQYHISRQHSALYQLPGGENRMWLGGTKEQAGFDASPTEQGREAILSDVARLVPGIRSASIVDHVAGLRPATPDGFPIVGRAPGWDNAYLATGAGFKGMLIGVGMAELVAQMVANLQPSISMDPFSLERFGGPQLTCADRKANQA